MNFRVLHALASALTAAVVVGCAEAPTRPAAPAPGAAPRAELTAGTPRPGPIDPGILAGVAASAADARERILPTLAESAARAALDTQLGRLETALDVGDLFGAADALDRARRALADVAASGDSALADVGAIELALDQAALLLPSIPDS